MRVWSQIIVLGLNYVSWMETQTIPLYIIIQCSQCQLFPLHNGITNVWRQSIMPRMQHITVCQYSFLHFISCSGKKEKRWKVHFAWTETYSSQLISLIMQEKKYLDIKIMLHDWELWCSRKVPRVFLNSSTYILRSCINESALAV